ncbi:MAG: hypothetical protein SGPRY_012998, partial [Prymnesium sp.]
MGMEAWLLLPHEKVSKRMEWLGSQELRLNVGDVMLSVDVHKHDVTLFDLLLEVWANHSPSHTLRMVQRILPIFQENCAPPIMSKLACMGFSPPWEPDDVSVAPGVQFESPGSP